MKILMTADVVKEGLSYQERMKHTIDMRNKVSTGPEGISLIQDVTLLEKATLVLTNILFVAIVDTSL